MEITAADHDSLRTIVLVVLGVLIAVIPLLMITLILRASAAKQKLSAGQKETGDLEQKVTKEAKHTLE